MAILEFCPNPECVPSFASLGQRFTTLPKAQRLYCSPLKMAAGGRLPASGNVDLGTQNLVHIWDLGKTQGWPLKIETQNI